LESCGGFVIGDARVDVLPRRRQQAFARLRDLVHINLTQLVGTLEKHEVLLELGNDPGLVKRDPVNGGVERNRRLKEIASKPGGGRFALAVGHDEFGLRSGPTVLVCAPQRNWEGEIEEPDVSLSLWARRRFASIREAHGGFWPRLPILQSQPAPTSDD